MKIKICCYGNDGKKCGRRFHPKGRDRVCPRCRPDFRLKKHRESMRKLRKKWAKTKRPS